MKVSENEFVIEAFRVKETHNADIVINGVTVAKVRHNGNISVYFDGKKLEISCAE